MGMLQEDVVGPETGVSVWEKRGEGDEVVKRRGILD